MDKLPPVPYILKHNNQSETFKDRLQGIFEQFDELEKEHVEREKHVPRSPLKHIEDDSDQEKQVTTFKVPKTSIVPKKSPNFNKPGSRPGYVQNPNKWKKYDLSDVEDSSDRSNAQTAHEFIRQLRANRLSKGGDQEDDSKCDLDSGPEFKFKKPSVPRHKHKLPSNPSDVTNISLSHLSDTDLTEEKEKVKTGNVKKKSRNYRRRLEDE